MKPADHDPLEQLPSLPTPEADEAHQRATMASSRAEFLRLAHSANATPGWLQNWRDRLELLPGWLVPGGFGLAGILVALAILPIVLTPQPDGTSPSSEPTLAEAPPAEIAAPTAPTTPPSGSVRMGAQPPVQTRSLQPEVIIAPDVPVSFENELVTLSARPEGGNLAIYQLRDGQQRLLGQIAASPDQAIVDALSYPRPAGEPEIIGVATVTPGQVPAWTVFLVDQAGARIDPGLTAALSGATDRADAEQRITAALLE